MRVAVIGTGSIVILVGPASVLSSFLEVARSGEELRRLAVALGRPPVGICSSPVRVHAAPLLQGGRLLSLPDILARCRLPVLQSTKSFLQLQRALVR